ncbi:MAG: hypothetical protein NVSMB42_03080 [Herpetosiphon sp.]
MPRTVFHLDAGGCGACGAEVREAVTRTAAFVWVTDPRAADIAVLSGTIQPSILPALVYTLALLEPGVPLIVAGRCAIEGVPFGTGGLHGPSGKALSYPIARLVGGCPPLPDVLAEALTEVLQDTVSTAGKG